MIQTMLLSISVALLVWMGGVKSDPLVDTPAGLIRGLQSVDGEYSMFLGVPYALVDENNPFGISSPHPDFNETFNAIDDSAACPQLSPINDGGTLQCLHLNIYVPKTATPRNLLPVMVWIHGGGFRHGSGNWRDYSPEFLIKQNVVLVFMNYRLGPYGFMCLEDSRVPGNQGLKDQHLALEWVNRNINAFGGDSSRVTLFGESGGAISVHWHLLANHEKLFHKAILQSGSAYMPGTTVKPDNTVPFKIAAKMDFVTENLDLALSFLAKQDPPVLVRNANALVDEGLIKLRPCVEKEFEGTYRFITDYAENLQVDEIQDIPMIFGFNERENLVYYQSQFLKVPLKDILGFDDEQTEYVNKFYFGDDGPVETREDEFIDMTSDFNFNHPIERSMKQFTEAGVKDIYYYVFSYDGGRNMMKIARNVTAPGATHGDELGYLFGTDLITGIPNDEDVHMIEKMTTLWGNFAKYGNPIPETSQLLPVKWTKISQNTRPYINIDSALESKNRPFKQRLTFWDLFYEYYDQKFHLKHLNTC
ncbi:cholinesterase 2-like [Bombyx mandarina]|uniref:Carboxylic ester hydrolase n=1 Tax=Bombyx mandarina TaxID=7092 RepID=A0A6J2K9Q2_BOMMA|nr:cholinesterase 2-like [Bombyx mandarina]XP_028038353.1 cholinesterase 2-like [Bombyx mandarina]XP_028038354.1 cholinesterase 2-like [Bombyx mandarina]